MQQAEEQVAHVQYSGACEAPDAIVLGYHPGGLAASLSLISSMLSMTQSWNRALLLWRKADWFYADPDECPDRQMACFFQAWHACDTDKVDNFLEGAMHIKVEESWTTRGVQPFAWVPPAHADKGLFWWRAVLNRFLFRLHPKFAGELEVDSCHGSPRVAGGEIYWGACSSRRLMRQMARTIWGRVPVDYGPPGTHAVAGMEVWYPPRVCGVR